MDDVRKSPKHSMLDLEHAEVFFVSTLILMGALAGECVRAILLEEKPD